MLGRLRRDWPESPLASEAAYRLATQALGGQGLRHGEAAGRTKSRRSIRRRRFCPRPLSDGCRLPWSASSGPRWRSPWSDWSASVRKARWCWRRNIGRPRRVIASANMSRRGEEFAALDGQTAGRTRKVAGHDSAAAGPSRWVSKTAGPMLWRSPSGSRRSIPTFAEQYEADYVIGRALASRGEFAAAREAYGRVIRSPEGGQDRNGGDGPMDDRRKLLPSRKLRRGGGGLSARRDSVRLAEVAGRRTVASGQVPGTAGPNERSRSKPTSG